ncbi:uncharacterized protein [Maniola hyperantus]|uniref:uncharacterized protein n=1 Tax=Aphantopus hyperantus TaxID=2795564 RepID=UPI003747FEB7
MYYNVTKTKVMIFKYKKGPENVLPIRLGGSELQYVTKFKYLGHVLSDTMKDNEDLERQRRSLAAKSNMLARRFTRCSRQVKVTLFKAYCQALYTSQLDYTKTTFDALRVQYNNAFRALLGLPWRCSASGMFAMHRVDDFYAVGVNVIKHGTVNQLRSRLSPE